MKVYVFGNADVQIDNRAILVAKKLENKIPDVSFVFIKPNEDVPFADEKKVVILDTVQGIKQVELIKLDEKCHAEFISASPKMPFRTHFGILKQVQDDKKKHNSHKLSASHRFSVHDFDLGFQLKYLKKLGKLGEVFIIGLPQAEEIDYSRINSILISLSQGSAGS